GLVVQGRGRGGSIKLADPAQRPTPPAASGRGPGRPPKQPAIGNEPVATRHTVTAKQRLEAVLWDIANTLRGKMSADDFRDYILGFIFYKYLSERLNHYANDVLEPDELMFYLLE